MKVSKKNILKIREFSQNFLDLKYDRDGKLTHKEFNNFLLSKGKNNLKHVNINIIKKSDILEGKYIFVQDDEGKVIPYQRPASDLKVIFEQINSKMNRIKALYTRKEYLDSIGYVELSNGVVIEKKFLEPEPNVTEKVNRIGVLKRKRNIR